MSNLGNKVSRLSAGTQARQNHRIERSVEPNSVFTKEPQVPVGTKRVNPKTGQSEVYAKKVKAPKKLRKKGK